MSESEITTIVSSLAPVSGDPGFFLLSTSSSESSQYISMSESESLIIVVSISYSLPVARQRLCRAPSDLFVWSNSSSKCPVMGINVSGGVESSTSVGVGDGDDGLTYDSGGGGDLAIMMLWYG